MLRSLILMLCTLVSLPVMAAEADEPDLPWWIEAQVAVGQPSRFLAWYQKELVGSFGFYAHVGLASNGYGEFYAGPTWKPTSWLQVGAGIGREADTITGNSGRRNLYYELSNGRFYSFGTVENGGSGRWYKVHAAWAFTERFGVGAMKDTDLGFGPRIEYNERIIQKLQLWSAVLHNSDIKKNTVVLGVNYSF